MTLPTYDYDGQCADCHHLRRELASYRTLPLVPKAEHDRVIEQRDQYARAMDGMAKQIANAADKRLPVAHRQALDLLQEGARLQSKDAGGPAERDYAQRRSAFLCEQGRTVADWAAEREAYEAREASRAK